MEENNEIIEKASDYVFELFKKDLSDELVYHNYNHSYEVVTFSEAFAEYYKLDRKEKKELLLAGWFHDVGYINTYRGHEEESVKIFKEFAKDNDLSGQLVKKVEVLILSTRHDKKPVGLLEEILHDADIINIGTDSFFERAELLRIEWERFLDRNYSDEEWAKTQIDFIVGTQFYTEYGQKEYGSKRDANIQEQRKRTEKVEEKNVKNKIREKKLGRGIETMYRATYRNHINLSSIADAKANMMISINTIIMSVIITLVGGGFTFTGQSFVENIRFTVPIMVLLVSALLSVIFAILSARPEVTSKDVSADKIKKKETSVLFFGNFVNMGLNDFTSSLKEFRGEQDLLYDNMSIDIYFLGIVLTKKYKLLRYSYNIFMGGLILCVVTFISIFFYTANANF